MFYKFYNITFYYKYNCCYYILTKVQWTSLNHLHVSHSLKIINKFTTSQATEKHLYITRKHFYLYKLLQYELYPLYLSLRHSALKKAFFSIRLLNVSQK